MARDQQGGFVVHVADDRTIEDHAREKFGPRWGEPDDRRRALRAGVVDREGSITRKGSDVLTKDALTLERNALAWLRSKFGSIRDEGHDSYGDLVGSFWYDPNSVRDAELIDLGVSERIDMVDSSYGDLADTAFKGVSSFGSSVLSGHVTFFDVDKDAIEETLDRARRASRTSADPRRRRRRTPRAPRRRR